MGNNQSKISSVLSSRTAREECCICIQPFSDYVSIQPCGHQLDKLCIQRWMDQNSASAENYPLCTRTLSQADSLPLPRRQEDDDSRRRSNDLEEVIAGDIEDDGKHDSEYELQREEQQLRLPDQLETDTDDALPLQPQFTQENTNPLTRSFSCQKCSHPLSWPHEDPGPNGCCQHCGHRCPTHESHLI